MQAVGLFIGLAIGLVAYLFGGLLWMTLASFVGFALTVVYGVFEFRRFQRDRAKTIARQFSAS